MITAAHFHAMVIHFPIALLIFGFLSEVISIILKNSFFRKAALYLLLVGTVGTIVAFLVGNAAADGMEEGVMGKAIALHEQAGLISLWGTIITALAYIGITVFKYDKTWARMICLILFAVVVTAIGRTGYLGGQLVYKHGAGVELALPDFKEP